MKKLIVLSIAACSFVSLAHATATSSNLKSIGARETNMGPVTLVLGQEAVAKGLSHLRTDFSPIPEALPQALFRLTINLENFDMEYVISFAKADTSLVQSPE